MRVKVLVVGDVGDDDWGYVGQRLAERGADLVRLDRDALPAWQETAGADLVLLLGSARSAHDPINAAVVAAEAALATSALDAGIPVLGICYGAQLLAHALGGSVGLALVAEVGMYAVESVDPVLCPPGPWAQFHSDAFVPPPTADALGSSPAGCQGFRDETRAARALGWQFHPEVTPQEFCRWLDDLQEWTRGHGIDPDAARADVLAAADPTREAALALTDSALAYLEVRASQPATS